ncbi:MAG: hypothetical protein J2O48_11145 [Solirubrobacterales bacterium]|nr:hypothetical protein [Solirubrobacterales bacterium]
MKVLTRTEAALLVLVVLATGLAALGAYAHIGSILAFVFAALALAGQAWMVSMSTEQLGERFGPGLTGTLQSTVGNLPEFFVVIFALQAGDTIVAQTALLGSILVNALLVLGLALVVGALRSPDKIMRFSPQLPNDTATLLLVASFMIVLLGLAHGAGGNAVAHATTISVVGGIAILLVYCVWLRQFLLSERQNETQIEPPAAGPRPKPRAPLWLSIGLLVLAGGASAFTSDWFVNALEPTIHQLHISQTFAGLVIVAIAGNAVENVAAIVQAARGQADLAISIVKSSVAQIAAFLYPALVLVSLLLRSQLTFSMAPIFIGALVATSILIWQITGDGEATPFEGAALMATFVTLGTVALYES